MLALALWHRDGGRCRRCGLPIDPRVDWRRPGALTIGHVVPLARGGTNDDRNLAPEHRGCNLAAGDREERPVATIIRP
jgi:5-methylcytosine-specific restriction endonuclease McrA